MILDIDLGNSRLKWLLRNHQGEVQEEGAGESARWADVLPRGPSLQRIRVASVRGDLNAELARHCRERYGVACEFARVREGLLGLSCAYREPDRLGVDRWLALLACVGEGLRRALVVDAGTALTLDLLDEGRHRGGFILPGLAAMARALGENTWGVAAAGREEGRLEAGRDTATCVANGALLAAVGAIERAWRQYAAPPVVVTGGDGPRLVAFFPSSVDARLRPDLVLAGLALALP
ncbi:MAG: type III pantothenate kinase [Porticoccaceae bacterium]|nr:MAG: type III pantothenate kinase [Porticoccaceae bacterium]